MLKTISLRLLVVGISLIFLTTNATTLGAQTIDQVVENFFPQWLSDLSVSDHTQAGPRPFRTSNFAVGDLNGDGSVDVVAAYSNGFEGSVRVLHKSGTTFTQIYEVTNETLGGDWPRVILKDLDKDGRPEAIISFASNRGSREVWIFKWTGTSLNRISPVRQDQFGNKITLLSDPDFIDLDGDGKFEVVQSKRSGPYAPDETLPIPPEAYEIFKFDGQQFVSLPTEFYREDSFVRRKGAPVSETVTFSVVSPNALHTMTIINGADSGTNRVSSATVRLNGNLIAGPSDFNQKVSVLVFQVPVASQNTLEVELKGEPSGYVTVVLRK